MAKLSQSVVAAEVGCKQSALSMFEQGDGTKLNEVVIVKLAKKFGVDLESLRAKRVSRSLIDPKDLRDSTNPGSSFRFKPSVPVIGFCPNPHCPSNRAYEVEGRTFLKPDRPAADPVGGKFCALCGEILEKRCPNCGAAIHDGAVCSFCGDPYVPILV